MLTHGELHEPVAPLEIIGPIMVQAAKSAKVPVCVHLDHCETLSYMARALELGFTGVMFDGSTLPVEENFEKTKTAVAWAKQTGASVEAEIGSIDGALAHGDALLTFCLGELHHQDGVLGRQHIRGRRGTSSI